MSAMPQTTATDAPHYRELDRAWQELTAPGAPFEMATITLRGAPTRVFRSVPATVRDLWLPTAAFGDRDYMIFEDERVTYREAHAAAAATANWLRARGIGRGDRVAIAMRNYPEWMAIYWGCVSIGVSVVGLNAWWTGEEIAYALRDSAPSVVFCDAERLARMQEQPEALDGMTLVVTRSGDVPAGALAWDDVRATGGTMPDAAIDPEDDACIFYTSGTTGFPKGARLTHRNCITNIYNIMFAGQAQTLALQRAGLIPPPPTTPPPPAVTLIPTPFFHVTGNTCLAFSSTIRGGAMVLLYKWDATRALELIERERVGEVSGVPVMAREILNHPDFASYDTSSLGSIGGGGASFQRDLVTRIIDVMPTARPRTGYGMTETSGSVTTISGAFLTDKPTSVGRLLPTFDARFVDDDGQDAEDGAVGELWVRGGAVIKGYLNQPEATADTITYGWLHTGDLARIDADGFVYIVDRKKDMIIRGGENIYCAEVENCVQQHPAVAECCVFAVPDDRLGEAVAAAIVLRAGASASAAEIAAYCGATLARHKVPAHLWFLDEPLPRNATGKFMKREVQARFVQREETGA